MNVFYIQNFFFTDFIFYYYFIIPPKQLQDKAKGVELNILVCVHVLVPALVCTSGTPHQTESFPKC